MEKPKRGFSGWVMVAAGGLLLAVAIGMGVNSFSLFVVPICEEFGYSRAAMAFCQTIQMMGGMLVVMLAGYIFSRFSVKKLMNIAALVFCAAYSGFSRASTLGQFYTIMFALAISSPFLTTLPLSIIIHSWFEENRGFAIGITFMGSGIGGMAFNALGGQLIARIGWRSTFLVFACIMAAVILPLTWFVLRMNPERAVKAHTAAEGEKRGVATRDLLRSGWFYALLLSFTAIVAATMAINNTMVPHLIDMGYPAPFAANTCAVYMGLLALSKILMGWVFDRFGVMKAMTLAAFSLLVAHISLCFARNPFALVLCVLFAGPGVTLNTIAAPILARSLFGERDSSVNQGILQAASSLGCALGPLYCGYIFDRTGHYTIAYASLAASAVLCAVLGYVVMKRLLLARQRWEGLEIESK